jgi:4-methyl-5(b-hydroxyethyl)-thiazole monophosphate biosynthesis
MKKKALVFLAAGFEEVEAITPIDYLRRADIEVTTVSISASLAVRGSHGIDITADKLIKDIPSIIEDYDALVFPGGGTGSDNLAASKELDVLIRKAAAGKLLCAICAAPVVVLGSKGLLKDHSFTCYPGMEEKLDYTLNAGAKWSKERVVVDGNLITSRAAGTAGAFSAAIIERIASKEAAGRIAAAVLL